MPSKNLTTKLTIQNLAAQLKLTFAKKTELPTKVSDLTNDSNYQTETQVTNAINAKIASVYKPGGTVAFADLPALVAANEGFVYNISDAFTTTADFVEGAGKKHKAGADVGIVNVGTAESPVYKYNVFANFVDLSSYMEKISGGTTAGLVKQTADGGVEDTGILADDVVTKVTGATAGNVAGLDANGKLTDTGVAADNIVTKVANATNDNLAGLNANGELTDSGVAAADVQQKLAANAFTAGNIRTTDANGFAQDGGIAATALLVDTDISDYTAEEIAALLAD